MRRARIVSPLASLVALALAGAVVACAGATPAPESASARTPAPAGDRARDFVVKDVAGRRVRLSDYLGTHVVVMNFWATWCVPCVAELPHLQQIYEAHKNRGLVVLAVSMDGPESVASVGPHARRYGLTFPILLDEETTVVQHYNPKRAAPYTLLFDRNGAVTKTREGFSSGDETEIEAELEALLGARR